GGRRQADRIFFAAYRLPPTAWPPSVVVPEEAEPEPAGRLGAGGSGGLGGLEPDGGLDGVDVDALQDLGRREQERRAGLQAVGRRGGVTVDDPEGRVQGRAAVVAAGDRPEVLPLGDDVLRHADRDDG